MTTATDQIRKTFTIVDSRDRNHTKTFMPGVYFDGDATQYCHIIYRNGKHDTVTIDKARRLWALIVDCNKNGS